MQWHWLPIVWGGLALMVTVQFWWSFYEELHEHTVWLNYFAVHLPIFSALCLYLISSFALPDRAEDGEFIGPALNIDDPTEEAIDLEAFYFDPARRHWFFGMFLLYLVLVQANDIVERAVTWQAVGLRGAFAVMFGTLMATRHALVHKTLTAGVLLLFLFFALQLSPTL